MLRWLKTCTSMPARISPAAMSACRSEKPSTRSGLSAMILSVRALVKAETLGFSRRACGGRTVKPEMPTMRQSSPKQVQRLGRLLGEADDSLWKS